MNTYELRTRLSKIAATSTFSLDEIVKTVEAILLLNQSTGMGIDTLLEIAQALAQNKKSRNKKEWRLFGYGRHD